MCGLAVVVAISDIFTSMGTLVSYRVGACRMMPAVPNTTAIVNNHKNRRSSTIATNFQSSFTWNYLSVLMEGKRMGVSNNVNAW